MKSCEISHEDNGIFANMRHQRNLRAVNPAEKWH